MFDHPGAVTVEGKAYDISNFKHPGGKVLLDFIGKDATDMFLAMHPPHSRARRVLASLPVVYERAALHTPFQELHRQVVRLVFTDAYASRVNRFFREQAFICCALNLAWIACLASPALSCLVYSVSMLHAGWFVHHAMHRQFDGYPGWLIELTTGYSHEWWTLKHNILHHSHTNVLGKDSDIDSALFAFDPSQAGMPLQHVFFWPLLSFLRISWCINGVTHGSSIIFLHHGIVLWLVGSYLSCAKAFVWYLTGNLLSGFMLGFVVVQSHTAETIVHDQGTDHLSHTAITTRNLPVGILNTFFTGYLNYQIEHHLFPWLPSLFFADVQPLVQDCFAAHQLPYTQLTWMESMYKLHLHLRDVKNKK